MLLLAVKNLFKKNKKSRRKPRLLTIKKEGLKEKSG